ncbi:hypothetical protein OS493_033254 [Desmophyllum pertusum]|uniref:Uncharacterized protein n=1 Tax=Desmophyllum pertusum TaxID=174260 RepID=A0A9W9ZY56_9CNID|nr:hypothetical protein OS493_033254 [Desmophyllum pertusum]
MSNELPNPQEKEQQRAASVSSEVVNIVEIFMEEEGSYQVMATIGNVMTQKVSSNSTIRSVVMEVNNTDPQNGATTSVQFWKHNAEKQIDEEKQRGQDTENIGRENPSAIACHKSLCQICQENVADCAI